jgi:hypothetical protein
LTKLNLTPETSTARDQDKQIKFKSGLKKAYHQKENSEIWDMATGLLFPHKAVTAAHIFSH